MKVGGMIVRAGGAMLMGMALLLFVVILMLVVMLLFVMMLMSASFVMFFTSAYAKHCGGRDGGDECISEIHGCILLFVNGQS